MKIEVIVGHILKHSDMKAVVNSANANLRFDSGVAGAIHTAAGPSVGGANHGQGVGACGGRCPPIAALEVVRGQRVFARPVRVGLWQQRVSRCFSPRRWRVESGSTTQAIEPGAADTVSAFGLGLWVRHAEV